MKEVRHGKATVRIQGAYDEAKLKESTERFFKKVRQCRKKQFAGRANARWAFRYAATTAKHTQVARQLATWWKRVERKNRNMLINICLLGAFAGVLILGIWCGLESEEAERDGM